RAQMRLETSSRTLELAKELDAEFPADRFATEALAEAALDVGEVQTAQVAADRLVAAAPEFAQGHVLRGRARRMSGDAAAAEESYRQALTLSPEHTDAQIALAYLLLDRGSFDESNMLFQELDEQGESAARGSTALMARIGGIEALLGLQRVAEAERQLDQLSPEDRDLVTVRMATARLALLQRRSTEAVSALRPLVGAEGATADVLALFADALESAGELDAASRYYELAVERDGGHPEALLGLARVLTRAERLDEAEEHMDRVEDSLQQRIRPPLLRAQLLLLQGRVRIQRGKMRAARVALQSASEIEGCPAEVWFFLGEALAGHNSPRSRAAYDRYLEIHPEGPFAARARRATDRPNP
ncbi:MAG: tetratricopeptide repeat protein, partial [Myxococcota bacterium]